MGAGGAKQPRKVNEPLPATELQLILSDQKSCIEPAAAQQERCGSEVPLESGGWGGGGSQP